MYIVCGIRRLVNTFENSTIFQEAIPIAGQYTLHDGTQLDPKITRLKTSSSASDREKEGFRLELHGPKYPDTDPKKQKAVIEFLCADKAEETKIRRKERDLVASKRGNDDENDGEEDHSATGEIAEDGHGGTVKYIDFAMVGDSQVLSLEWRTKYACENAKGEDKGSSSGHWGFFTWFIIMYVDQISRPKSHFISPHPCQLQSANHIPGSYRIFLATAAYLIFGSWLNYNRYSARGWDLVPHSETIRDIPYIFKDWMRRVVNTLQGGGSRGGYSAV